MIERPDIRQKAEEAIKRSPAAQASAILDALGRYNVARTARTYDALDALVKAAS